MKKVFTTCAALAVTSLIVFSCKKSSNTTTPSSTTSTTGATTGVTTPPNALLTAWNTFGDNTLSAGGVKDSSATATAQNIAAVSIGTVTINMDTVPSFGGGEYSTAVSLDTILPFTGKPTWKITGANGFGAFSYTTAKTMPKVGDLHLSQSSFSRSANLVLTHATITADSISYTVDDGSGHQAQKVIIGSSSGCTFTPAMMASLTTSNGIFTGSISITAHVLESSVHGSKNIYFINLASYVKSGITITN